MQWVVSVVDGPMEGSGRVDRDRKWGDRASRRRRSVVLVVVVAALLSACSGPNSGGPKSASDRRPLPTVTDVSPNSGPTTGGTIVTITGRAFTGTTKVSFGSVAASSFHVVSGNEVTAISPRTVVEHPNGLGDHASRHERTGADERSIHVRRSDSSRHVHCHRAPVPTPVAPWSRSRDLDSSVPERCASEQRWPLASPWCPTPW